MDERSGKNGEVSLAQQIRTAMQRQVTLAMLEGVVVTVRRGSMSDFLFSGAIPVPLLDLVLPKNAKRDVDAMTVHEWGNTARFTDLVVSHFVVAPRVVAPVETEPGTFERPPLAPGEIGTWELPDSAKQYLFQLAMTDAGFAPGTAALFSPVPDERAGSDRPAPAGADVPAAPVGDH